MDSLLDAVDVSLLEAFLKPLPFGKVTLEFSWADIGMAVEAIHESGARAFVTDVSQW